MEKLESPLVHTLHAFLVGREVLLQGAGNPLDTHACPGPAGGPAI